MAGNGPPPAEHRRRRNADTYADVAVKVKAGDATVRGPRLTGRYLAATREWYETWRRAPQAAAFVDTDWRRLLMLAPLVDAYFRRPHHLTLGEIRQNESLLGATHVDRLKARIKVELPAEDKDTAPSAGVTAINDYRSRIAG